MKVHRLLCLELKKFVDKITPIFASIESARPRCTSGLRALCDLHVSLEKANLLLCHCSECSKFYLAITGEKIVLRCEKIRHSLESVLTQIQNMVPSLLADQISRIAEELRTASFSLEPSEYEAGKVLLALLHQDIAPSSLANTEELKAYKFAALRLHVTSPVAVLIEKRSIRKLLDKISDADPTRRKILNYLLYMVKKHGKSARESLEPPEEFKCALSMKLMSDPVTIASGETFERLWIEKWFDNGHKTCPKTLLELSNFSMTPNFVLKELISRWHVESIISSPDLECSNDISKWLSKHSSSISVTSFGSSVKHLKLQVSNITVNSSDANSSLDSLDANFEHLFEDDLKWISGEFPMHGFSSSDTNGKNFDLLTKLSALSWGARRNAVEDAKNQLTENRRCLVMIRSSYIGPIARFLKDARHVHDSKALKDGIELLLIFLRELRDEPSLPKDMFYVLASFLDSEITGQVLDIMELLSTHPCYDSEFMASGVLSTIIKILKNPISQCHLPALKVLRKLSSHSGIAQHMVYLGYFEILVPFLDDLDLAGICLQIFRNLVVIDEAADEFARIDGAVASLGELVEVGNDEVQELTMDVLLCLCHRNVEVCELVSRNLFVSSLALVSAEGNSGGKSIAAELLQLLKNFEGYQQSIANTVSNLGISEGKKSSYRSSIFGRKISIFSKSKS